MRSQREESERERRRGREREGEEEEEKRQKRQEDIHIHPPVASQPATYTRLPPITCGRDRKSQRERERESPHYSTAQQSIPRQSGQNKKKKRSIQPYLSLTICHLLTTPALDGGAPPTSTSTFPLVSMMTLLFFFLLPLPLPPSPFPFPPQSQE